jgi:hypothetical protein
MPAGFVDQRHHLAFDVDHVGAGLAAHRHAERSAAVGVEKAVDFEVAEPDLGDFAEPGQGIATGVYDDLFEVLDTIEAADGAQQVAPLAGLDFAAGNIAVAFAYRAAQLAYGQVALGQPRRIDQDLDLARGAAVGRNLGYSRHGLEAGGDIVTHEILLRRHVEVTRVAGQRHDAKVHERVRRKRGCIDARFVDVVRVSGNAIERGNDVDQRLVQIDAERKFELYARATEGGRRDDTLQARHAAQLIFLLDQYFLFDVLRRRAGPGRAHRDRAHLEVRNHLHRDARGRDQAEHGHDQRRDRDQDAVPDHLFEHDLAIRLAHNYRLPFVERFVTAHHHQRARLDTAGDRDAAAETQPRLHALFAHPGLLAVGLRDPYRDAAVGVANDRIARQGDAACVAVETQHGAGRHSRRELHRGFVERRADHKRAADRVVDRDNPLDTAVELLARQGVEADAQAGRIADFCVNRLRRLEIDAQLVQRNQLDHRLSRLYPLALLHQLAADQAGKGRAQAMTFEPCGLAFLFGLGVP